MPFERVAELIVRPQVLAGMDRMQPDIRTLVNELLLRFTTDDAAPRSVTEEGAAVALWGHNQVDAFLDWHREIGGLARALDVMLAATGFHRRTYEWDNSIWALARARPAIGLSNLGPVPWMWLRRELAASPAERDAVREVAGRASRAWHMRCALAYVFPELWSAADERELRHADLDDWHSVWLGLFAAMRAKPLDARTFSRPYDLIEHITPALVAERLAGEPAVAALRLIKATETLATFEHPDALRALAELSDLSTSWRPLASIAPTRAAIAALAPMFTTLRPRRVRGVHLAKGLFYELIAAAPDEAAEVDDAFVATAIDETGVRLPADQGWVSPWSKTKPKPKAGAKSKPAPAGPPPAMPFEETIHWKPGERDQLAGVHAELRGQRDEEYAAKCVHEGKVGKSFVLYLSWISDALALQTWKAVEPKKWYAQADDVEQLLARFGLAELDSIVAFVTFKPDTLKALSRVESPRVAQVMARGFALIKKMREVGKAWLDDYPEAAAIGLVTAAHTRTDAKQREANTQALAHVTARHPKIVEAVLAKAGGTIAPAEITEAAAPSLPARAPKLPPFVDLDRLPRPITREGHALAGAGLAEFVQVLKAAVSTSGPDGNPIIESLAQRYTPESLARLAWGLFRQWLFAEGPPKDKWAHYVLGRFPDDDNARALGRLARYWAPSGNPTRAQDAVEVLAQMRTQQALIEIHEIATEVQSKALRARAETVFETVAESLGIGTSELADRLIPELGVDDLSFGELHVELDVHLVPHLVAPDGGSVDKPHEAEEVARFKELKKTCAAVARGQTARLEQAMAEAHRMPFSHFSEIYAMHSLIRHLARGVVWGAYRDGGLAFAFALAADGPIDRAGAPLELPVDARYGVVHPVELTEAERAAWAQRIGEQPFEQLARAVFPTSSTAVVQAALLSLIGKTVRTAGLLELQRHGWRRGESPQGGQYYSVERSGTHWRAELVFMPGIYLGAPTEQLSQTIEAISFDAEPETPIAVLSEIQRDLARLR